nr:putative reverse transcriptase domain-containing protein [Tanacetum cinerariifolium]
MVAEDDEIANQDNSPRINRGVGYDNQILGNVAGARETVEQVDWRDDTDDKPEDQELEAHYMYMVQIQEVTPNADDNSGLIFDTEPVQKTEFHLDEDDVLWQGTRLCVPNDATLREALLTEAHSSLFFVHPGSTKMYHDLKQHFWWSGMKRDVATFVSRCLICQQVKIEHQRASGLLQPLDIPVWK